MSAVGMRSIVIFLMLALPAAVFIGCDALKPDRTGTAVENQEPKMFFVNTPPDSAQFSRNPELNWYATDIDGYITLFRHAVVVESLLVIGGKPVSPEAFIEQATDQQFGWDTLPVDLDHPQSRATIRLYADTDNPVDSFVTQYFFVQARDNQGALSKVIYRMYSRNNHYPNTSFRVNSFYINAKDASAPQPGIRLSWRGADSTDWGRAIPPLEYEWRIYGPFDTLASINVKLAKENCTYDPVGDSLINCIDVPVLDLDRLPEAVGGIAQPLLHSEGPNYANDPNDVWITANQVTVYNVFKNLNLQETSKYRFVFWVRARDDGFLPDPTPAFAQFNVFEAKFERPILVLDETGYTRPNGRWAPRHMSISKRELTELINGAGYTAFDTLQDYFFTANQACDACPPITPNFNFINLVDILSHRILFLYNDDVDGPLNEGEDFGLSYWTFVGMYNGASGLLMSRNLGGGNYRTPPKVIAVKSPEFQDLFGIADVTNEGWFYELISQRRHFNEEFIGAYSNIRALYPDIMVDYGRGSSLDTLYPRIGLDTSHVMNGLPEVGIGTRTQFAAPLYLYLSKDGDKSYFHGKVNAVLQQRGDMRSACFLFTPLAMKRDQMQETFTTITAWLEAKFTGGAKASIPGVTNYETAGSSVEERRLQIEQAIQYIDEYASPELKKQLGLTLPPYVVSPGDGR